MLIHTIHNKIYWIVEKLVERDRNFYRIILKKTNYAIDSLYEEKHKSV